MEKIQAGNLAILEPPTQCGLIPAPEGSIYKPPAPVGDPLIEINISAPDGVKPYKPLIDWMRMAHFGTPLTGSGNMMQFNVADILHHWHEWNYNSIRNVNLQLPPLHELFSRTENDTSETENYTKSVLLVGAGPSAREEVNLTKLRKDRYLFDKVICVDRAFKFLKEQDIDPDLIFVEDASDRVYDFLFGEGQTPPDPSKTAIAFCAFAGHKAVVEAVNRGYKCYLYASANPFSPFWITFYNVYGKEYVGARCGVIVSFSALDAAWWMGYGNIVFLGNDLCYPDPFSALADGMGSFSIITREAEKKWYYTIEAFRMAYDQMQGYAKNIKEAPGPTHRLIDCTIDWAMPKEYWERVPFKNIKKAIGKIVEV